MFAILVSDPVTWWASIEAYIRLDAKQADLARDLGWGKGHSKISTDIPRLQPKGMLSFFRPVLKVSNAALITQQASNNTRNSRLTLMLAVANLANTKWCKKTEKKLWHIGTHLRVFSESYLMDTNMTGFRWFSKIFVCWNYLDPMFCSWCFIL